MPNHGNCHSCPSCFPPKPCPPCPAFKPEPGKNPFSPPPPTTLPPPPPPPLPHGQRETYEWNGLMLVAVIGCLFTVFITTVTMYYIYFRLCSTRLRPTVQRRGSRRTEISRARRFSWRSVDGYYFTASPTNEGLSGAAVEALPVFVFKAEDFKDGMRCAVCLCEFEENERGRILPNCGHSFHVECIDMWFYSHSTCPLCRQEVETVVEVEDSSAENKLLSVSGSSDSAYQLDGVHERKETEGERIEEPVAIAVPAREESHV